MKLVELLTKYGFGKKNNLITEQNTVQMNECLSYYIHVSIKNTEIKIKEPS